MTKHTILFRRNNRHQNQNNADNNHANVDQSKHHWESSSAYRSAGCAGSWSSLYRCQPACAMKNLKRSVFLWTSTKMRRKRRKKPVNVQEDPKTGGRRQKQTHQKNGKCLGKIDEEGETRHRRGLCFLHNQGLPKEVIFCYNTNTRRHSLKNAAERSHIQLFAGSEDPLSRHQKLDRLPEF